MLAPALQAVTTAWSCLVKSLPALHNRLSSLRLLDTVISGSLKGGESLLRRWHRWRIRSAELWVHAHQYRTYRYTNQGQLGQLIGPLWCTKASEVPNMVLYTTIIVSSLPSQ
jgi:hypothetical protein